MGSALRQAAISQYFELVVTSIGHQPDHVCGALDVCEASSTPMPTTMPTTKKDTTTMPPETTTSS